MSTIINGSSPSVTFSDGTTQATAFVLNGQAFTSSGTFTIPTGITNLKVTVVGGGGGGGSSPQNGQGGGGGGSGGVAIKYLTGLTPGNTLSVTVGGQAGNSTVASGTQTISTITGGGGGNGGSNAGSGGGAGAGGTASGGTINISGNAGRYAAGYIGIGAQGGSSIFGGGGPPPPNSFGGINATNYGSGGSGAAGTGCCSAAVGGSSGYQGIVIIEW
jgi:hypothetical protein